MTIVSNTRRSMGNPNGYRVTITQADTRRAYNVLTLDRTTAEDKAYVMWVRDTVTA